MRLSYRVDLSAVMVAGVQVVTRPAAWVVVVGGSGGVGVRCSARVGHDAFELAAVPHDGAVEEFAAD